MSMNLPNQITMGRLALTVVLFILLAQFDLQNHNALLMHAAFWLFVVAALTDAVDGYIARRQNQVTSFGRVLDPVVDKVLVCGTFVMFLGPDFINEDGRNATDLHAWMVVLILGREFLITALRGLIEKEGKPFGANVYGKAKMLVQSFTAGYIIFSLAVYPTAFGSFLGQVRPVLVWLTVIVTAISLVAYLARAKSVFTETTRA